jgi:branched-chain amino acid aminotransferase
MDGRFVLREDAKVSVFDHGFLYGDGCFEGIRAYNGRVFKLRSHLKRMFRSAEKIRLTPKYTIDEIESAVRKTISRNGLTDAYVRLVFSRGIGSLGLHPFKCPEPGTIVIADTIALYPPELYEEGLQVIVANMLNVDGYVSECTGDNIFIVKDDLICTPSPDAGFLHGITRRFVIDEVGPACGYAVREKMMRVDEILEADEVFLTGTAAEIIGVTHVGDTAIGMGEVGPVTQQLTAEFRQRIAHDAPED